MEKWEDGKELIFPLRGPGKGNWKKISKDQGQQAQNPNTHTQNVSGLSGSKRTGKLDFSDKDEKRPHKKLHDTPHTDANNTFDRPAMAAKHHCQE